VVFLELLAEESMGSKASPHLLLVEDDLAARAPLAKMLRRMGFEVSEATTVAAAIRSLNDSLDTVVLDLMLPDGDGGDVLRRIREQKLPAMTAVVTAVEDRAALDRVIALKPDAFFGKPLDLADFTDWLKGLAIASRLNLDAAPL
jgi:DNA-binding response OmpR family regulator